MRDPTAYRIDVFLRSNLFAAALIIGAAVTPPALIWLAMPLLVALSEQLTFQVCCPWLILAMLKLVAVLFRVEEFVEFNILSR